MRNRGPIRVLRVLFGLLALAALSRQLAVHRALGFSLTNFFSYFTNLSNLFAGGVLLLAAAPARAIVSDRSLATLRTSAVINMSLVGILFTLLLRNTDLGSLLPWVNVVHHYLMPCILVLDWIAAPPSVQLGRRELMIGLVFPLAYVTYVLIRGNITDWYPYPFLNARNVGATGVAAYTVAITMAFVLVGWGLIGVGNWRRIAASRAPAL